jgi:hypothetical protein
MATTFGVYLTADVKLTPAGNGKLLATAKPVSTHDDFDAAYEAAQSCGGARWVISSNGSSEFVSAE